MAGKTSKFMIGIFVTAGLIMAVVAIVWLGASKYLQKGTLFVTYFDESVQGLSVDSNVKYRGVNVGTVRSIEVAPDQKLIEVVMKIFMKGGDEKNLTSKLKSAGLTGVVLARDALPVNVFLKDMNFRYILVNEEAALSRESVHKVFKDKNIALLVADWTSRNPEITALLEAHQRSGVPLYLYYAPGAAEAVVLPQILTEGEVLQTIGAAR